MKAKGPGLSPTSAGEAQQIGRTKLAQSRWVVMAGISLALVTGCQRTEPVEPDPAHDVLRVVSTTEPLDAAVATAISEHLQVQGVATELHTVAHATESLSILSTQEQLENTIVVANSLDFPRTEDENSEDVDLSEATRDTTDSENGDDSDASDNPSPRTVSAADSEEYVRDYLTEHGAADVEVLSTTEATFRLTAVTTHATAGQYSLESVADLGVPERINPTDEPNGPDAQTDDEGYACEQVEFSWGATPHQWQPRITRILSAQHCQPTWVAGSDADFQSYQTLIGSVVTPPEHLTFLYGADPAIEDHGLLTLDDSQGRLPEGRIVVLGDTDLIDADVTAPLEQVTMAMNDEQLTSLVRMVNQSHEAAEGLELDSESAARWWLTHADLLDEDFVVPAETP